jgi:hypothetical protein
MPPLTKPSRAATEEELREVDRALRAYVTEAAKEAVKVQMEGIKIGFEVWAKQWVARELQAIGAQLDEVLVEMRAAKAEREGELRGEARVYDRRDRALKHADQEATIEAKTKGDTTWDGVARRRNLYMGGIAALLMAFATITTLVIKSWQDAQHAPPPAPPTISAPK